jgi:hypothetical protein
MVDITAFMDKVKKIEKNELADLSSGEDLSIGIMNLISIEEHLFFSFGKTKNKKYLDLLTEVREMRKNLLKIIIKDYEGEVWCISKHLLAASMRLMEVGTKYQGRGDNQKAEELFKKSYELYSMFWVINLTENQNANLKNQNDNAKSKIDQSVKSVPREFDGLIRENPGEDKIILMNDKNEEGKMVSIFEKAGNLVQKILDCCKE